MPKEVIRADAELIQPYEIVVGWTPDQWAQLGLQTEGQVSLVWQLLAPYAPLVTPTTTEQLGETVLYTQQGPFNRPNLIEIGKKMRELVQLRDQQPMTSGSDQQLGEDLLNALDVLTGAPTSVWFNFDRPASNRLVKAVRRARNAVFGADE